LTDYDFGFKNSVLQR